MNNGKRRRLAKVARGGEAGSPSPLGSRADRRRPVDKAAMENSYQTRLRLVRESLRAPAPEVAVGAAVE